MRKLFCALTVTSAHLFALAVHAAPPANFAGTWTLDKSKSQGLNQRQQNAESVSWVITQTDKDITIEEKMTGGNSPAGDPPAGGPPPGVSGGGGGQGRGMAMGGPRTFNLDGSETSTDTGRGKVVRTATVSADGQTIELSTRATFQGPEGEITTTSSEKLQLSADGKVLTVIRQNVSPRGTQDSTLVFNK